MYYLLPENNSTVLISGKRVVACCGGFTILLGTTIFWKIVEPLNTKKIIIKFGMLSIHDSKIFRNTY